MSRSNARRLFTVQVCWSDTDPDLLTISYEVKDLVNDERLALWVRDAPHFPGDDLLRGEAGEVLADMMRLVGVQLPLF